MRLIIIFWNQNIPIWKLPEAFLLILYYWPLNCSNLLFKRSFWLPFCNQPVTSHYAKMFFLQRNIVTFIKIRSRSNKSRFSLHILLPGPFVTILLWKWMAAERVLGEGDGVPNSYIRHYNYESFMERIFYRIIKFCNINALSVRQIDLRKFWFVFSSVGFSFVLVLLIGRM